MIIMCIGGIPQQVRMKNIHICKGDKGDQGNSGYTGAANEREVVNNLTEGGATKALSAEQGKVLNKTLMMYLMILL